MNLDLSPDDLATTSERTVQVSTHLDHSSVGRTVVLVWVVKFQDLHSNDDVGADAWISGATLHVGAGQMRTEQVIDKGDSQSMNYDQLPDAVIEKALRVANRDATAAIGHPESNDLDAGMGADDE